MSVSKPIRLVAVNSLWVDALLPLLPPTVELVNVDGAPVAERDAALADARIVLSVVFDAAMAKATPHLELLICPAAGTEHIDRSILPPHVRLLNAPGAETAIAEYVIGALVALRRHFAQADAALRRGEWLYGFHNAPTLLRELSGSALGVVGFGRIGQEVYARAAAFGMLCAAVTLHPDRHRDRAGGLQFLESISDPAAVDRLVSWSDAVVLCCELSPVTKGLIDARRFQLMKRDALLVNVARGDVVDEAALFEALDRKQINGAALDVWYRYPHRNEPQARPATMPFERLDNVLMTPHASGWTDGNKRRRLEWLASVIRDFADASQHRANAQR